MGQARPLCPLSSRLAALMEMETLACTVPVLPISTRRRKHYQEAPAAPTLQNQPQTSSPRRHPTADAGERTGTSPVAPAKPCQHQLQGQEQQKQRPWDLHSEKHLIFKNSSLT